MGKMVCRKKPERNLKSATRQKRLGAHRDTIVNKCKCKCPDQACFIEKSAFKVANSTEQFYAGIKCDLKKARSNPYGEESKKLKLLIRGIKEYDEVHQKVARAVRVDASKKLGAVVGTGLDELFKTSETAKFIEYSLGGVKGKAPTSRVKNSQDKLVEIDWMDAQRIMRVSTDGIFWAIEKIDAIGGHSGTLTNGKQGSYLTTGQADAHNYRQVRIEERKSPADAMFAVIVAHLEYTEKLFEDPRWKAAALHVWLANGQPLRKQIDGVKTQIRHIRKKLKIFAKILKKATLDEDKSMDSGGLSDFSDSGSEPHGDDIFEIDLSKETQLNFPALGDPKPIPGAREDPVCKFLRKKLASCDEKLITRIANYCNLRLTGPIPKNFREDGESISDLIKDAFGDSPDSTNYEPEGLQADQSFSFGDSEEDEYSENSDDKMLVDEEQHSGAINDGDAGLNPASTSDAIDEIAELLADDKTMEDDQQSNVGDALRNSLQKWYNYWNGRSDSPSIEQMAAVKGLIDELPKGKHG